MVKWKQITITAYNCIFYAVQNAFESNFYKQAHCNLYRKKIVNDVKPKNGKCIQKCEKMV